MKPGFCGEKLVSLIILFLFVYNNATAKLSGTLPGAIHHSVTTAISADSGKTDTTSAGNTLLSVSLSAGTLSPAFNAQLRSYTDSVVNQIQTITITASAVDTSASIFINGVLVRSGSPSPALQLNQGNNTFTITVNPADSTLINNTYTIVINRALPPDADLTNLIASKGTLTPAFSSATTNYATAISIKKKRHVVYTIGDSITENGEYAAELSTLLNNTFQFVNFGISGDNPVNMANRFSTIVNAAPDYVIIMGGLNSSAAIPIENSLQSMYNSAHNAGIKVIAMTITPWKGHPQWTAAKQAVQDSINTWISSAPNVDYVIDMNHALADPANPLQLTSQYDGGDHVHPNKAGQDYMASVIYARVPFTPNPRVEQYNAAANSLTITPQSSDPQAQIKVNGQVVASGAASQSIPLILGNTSISTMVTAQDGVSTKTYTLAASGTPSNNAELANFTINTPGGISVTPFFTGNTTSYTASENYTSTSTQVKAPTVDENATVTINNLPVASGALSQNIPLNIGANNITAVVTAPDGTTKTYSMTVTRASGSNADLTNLVANNNIVLSPSFNSAVTTYTSSIPNTTSSVKITPTAADALAVVSINGVVIPRLGTSQTLPLAVGKDTISVVVTAQNQTNKIYQLIITRAPSANANLAGLATSNGVLSPAFTAANVNYTTAVSNDVTSIKVTPTATEPNATIRINNVIVTSGTASAALPLVTGSNTITIKVTAQDGTTSKTYKITATRLVPADVNLASLDNNAGPLNPSFQSTITSYSLPVANSVTTINFTPLTSATDATVKVNNLIVTRGQASPAISLVAGVNAININVTAKDGITNKTYTVNVNRAPSANANINNITLNNALISPAFDANTFNYTASTAYENASIKITPTLADSTATVTVNGVASPSGQPSPDVPLVVGTNNISVIATAQDGTTQKSYLLTVTRASNSNLSGLQLTAGTLSPAFTSSVSNYTALVTNTVTSVKITPTVADPAATVTVNGSSVASGASSAALPLTVGPNNISITVQAVDGTTKTYTVVITRALPNNANLNSLTLNSGDLSPAFSSSVVNYSVAVDNAISALILTGTAADAKATIKVHDVAVNNGSAVSVPLVVGVNNIRIVVTAQDGTVKTYKLTATRLLSANADLSALIVSNAVISPAFGPAVTNYTSTVASTVTMVKITPTAADAGATIKVNGAIIPSGTTTPNITLKSGFNNISIAVTAANGSTIKTYSVTISRLSSNANLSNLAISDGILSPAFATATVVYTTSVDNSITTVKITPTTSDVAASVTINGTAVPSATASPSLSLQVGNNLMTVKVTAFGGTVKTYKVTVNRAASQSASFAALSGFNYSNGDILAENSDISVPEALSPNGDGINDFLKIEGLANHPDNTLSIINSSGLPVFESRNYDNSSNVFDGHSSLTGRMQQPGTYFYILQYKNDDQSVRKTGYIILKY